MVVRHLNRDLHYTHRKVWDPYVALEICNEDSGRPTCVGWAPSKGRRCRNPTNADRREKAIILLRQISETEISCLLKQQLRSLAYNCLCKLHGVHPDYETEPHPALDDVLSDWKCLIQAEQKRILSAKQRQQTAVPKSTKVRTEEKIKEDTSWNETLTRFAKLLEQYEMMLQNDKVGGQTDGSVLHTNNTVETIERARNEDSQVLPPVEQYVQHVVAPQPAQIVALDDNHEEEALIDMANTQEWVDKDLVVASSANASCDIQHVTRRSISEECLICKESCSKTALDDLTWCKSRCGYSMHKSCFDAYLDFLPSNGCSLKCPHCNEVWPTQCQHDEQIPDYVTSTSDIWEEQDEYLLLFVVMLYLILKDIFGWSSLPNLFLSKKSYQEIGLIRSASVRILG